MTLPSASSRTVEFERPVVAPDLKPTAIPRPRPGGRGAFQPNASAARRSDSGQLPSAGTSPRTISSPLRARLRMRMFNPSKPELPSGFVHLRLHCPGDLGRAEAAKGAARRRVRQHSPGVDSGVGRPVWATAQVVRLGHDPLCDVGIGADQKVRLDVLKDDIARSRETAADVYFCCGPPNGLECLLQAEDQPARSARAKRQIRHQWLKLRVLLPAEAAARIGSKHAHLTERQVEQLRHDPLQQKRMLDRAPNLSERLYRPAP